MTCSLGSLVFSPTASISCRMSSAIESGWALSCRCAAPSAARRSLADNNRTTVSSTITHDTGTPTPRAYHTIAHNSSNVPTQQVTPQPRSRIFGNSKLLRRTHRTYMESQVPTTQGSTNPTTTTTATGTYQPHPLLLTSHLEPHLHIPHVLDSSLRLSRYL